MYELMSTDEIMIDFAKRIKKVRLKMDYSQKEFAIKCGIGYTTYQAFEKNGSGSFKNFLKIMQKFGKIVQMEAILKDELFSPKESILSKKTFTRQRSSRKQIPIKNGMSVQDSSNNLNTYLEKLKEKNGK